MRRPAKFFCVRRRATRRASFLSTSSQTLSVLSCDADTMSPFGRAATHWTCAPRGVDEQSTHLFDWTPAPRWALVPAQRLEAGAGRRVPDLERVVARSGHDVAIRQRGDAIDLRRRGVDKRSTCGSTGRRRCALSVCPLSVWRQSPVDTSHTLSVRSRDPDTTRSSGRMATP